MQGRTTTDLLASPATTALSNTSLRLRCVKELHSTYVSQPELILVYNSKKKIIEWMIWKICIAPKTLGRPFLSVHSNKDYQLIKWLQQVYVYTVHDAVSWRMAPPMEICTKKPHHWLSTLYFCRFSVVNLSAVCNKLHRSKGMYVSVCR